MQTVLRPPGHQRHFESRKKSGTSGSAGLTRNSQEEAQTAGSHNRNNDSIACKENQPPEIQRNTVPQILVHQVGTILEKVQRIKAEICSNSVQRTSPVNYQPPAYSTSAYKPYGTPHHVILYHGAPNTIVSALQSHGIRGPTAVATGKNNNRRICSTDVSKLSASMNG